MNMKQFCAAALVCTLTASIAQAEITWVGGTSTDIFDESNWDLSNSTVTVIDPNVTIADDARDWPGPNLPITRLSPRCQTSSDFNWTTERS